jgi:hypothetical protein
MWRFGSLADVDFKRAKSASTGRHLRESAAFRWTMRRYRRQLKMLCKNKRCMREIGMHYWGDGYCSERCFHNSVSRANGARDEDYLSDPSDPTGRRAIARTRDEIDAMLEACDIDPHLPRIIYLARREFGIRISDMLEAAKIDKRLPKIILMRRQRCTFKVIGKACELDASQCNRIMARATHRMLRSCGLAQN